MASSSTRTLLSLSLFLTLCALSQATYSSLILTLVNNCPYTIWPAIQPNAGHPVLERGGFALHTLTHRSFTAPTTHWSGRIWARTGCSYAHGKFSCATGDCGGRIECEGLGGATPATLAQFALHHGHADFSSYGVSLVDGFNIPLTVTPHEGNIKLVCNIEFKFYSSVKKILKYGISTGNYLLIVRIINLYKNVTCYSML